MPALPVQVYRDNGLTSLPLQQPYFMYNRGGYVDPDAERYGIGGILKSVAPIAAGFAMGPMGLGFGTMAQIGAGALTGFGLGGFNNVMDAITGGLAGYAGGGMSAAMEAAGGAGATAGGTAGAAAQSGLSGGSPFITTPPGMAPQLITTPVAAQGMLPGGISVGGSGYGTAIMDTVPVRPPSSISGVSAAQANQPPNTAGPFDLGGSGGGPGYPIRDATTGTTTIGQNISPSLTSAGRTAPAQSFGDYLKGKLTDPKTLGLGAATMMLGQEQEEWDDTAGTFPNVNKALTEEERAAYAMKGLTDPANTTFQPPNIAFGGMPTSLFGREGGAVDDWELVKKQAGHENAFPKQNTLFAEGGSALGELKLDKLGTIKPTTTPETIGEPSTGIESIDVDSDLTEVLAGLDPEDFVSSEGEVTLQEGLESLSEDTGPFSMDALTPEMLESLTGTLSEMQEDTKGFGGAGKPVMGRSTTDSTLNTGPVSKGAFGPSKSGSPFKRNYGGPIPFHKGGLPTHVHEEEYGDNYFEDTYGPDWRTRDLSQEEEDRFISDIERSELLKSIAKDKLMEERGLMFNPDIPWTPEMQSYAPYREMAEGGSIPFQAGGPTAPPQMNPQAMQHLQQEAAKGVPWAVELMGRINQRGQPAQQTLGPQVQRGMAEGGAVLESGSFVIPADVVSSFGDGSSDEGHRKLSDAFSSKFARGGNIIRGEIKGPGGGLDDLVQSSIEGVRSARVSNDEFVIPSSVVSQIGGGNTKAGSEKLYNFIKNVRLNKHGSTQQPASINNVGLNSLLS